MSSPTQTSPVRVQQAGNVRILSFTDVLVPDPENTIARELEGHTDELTGVHLLLDFGNVQQIHSVELGTIITLHKRIRESGGRLTLFNLSDQVYEIFAVCRLQVLLQICREAQG